MYSFEKLEVWKEAIQLAVKPFKINEKLPNDEKFGLTSQLIKCPVSVSSNIAEVTARITSKDKAHFMTMTYGSALELFNQTIILKEFNFISQDNYLHLRT